MRPPNSPYLPLSASSLVTIPKEDCPPDLWRFQSNTCQINEFNIRAAGYTLLTAVALFAGILPATQVQMAALSARMAWDWIAEISGRLLGVAGSFGAGWYWLGAETFGNRGEYINPMLGFVGFAAIFVVSGAWTSFAIVWFVKAILFNLSILTLVWSVLIPVAIVWYLWEAIKFHCRLIRAAFKRIRSVRF